MDEDRDDMTKIFLDDFGIFLGCKRNRFVVKKGKDSHEFLADDVDSIVCTSRGAAVSSSALNLAINHNVQVVFARYSGWPYAMVMPTTMTGSVRARREQFSAYTDERGFMLAKGFVKGKIKNQANLLKLMAKNRKQTEPSTAEKLYRAGRLIDEVYERAEKENGLNIDDKRQDLMNLEAEAARTYWGAVGAILPIELGFDGRETRGARDPFNAMLNYGYQAVLFPEVWKALCYAGLDPHAGFLHADRPGKPSLVLDLIEEFRQQVVDRTLFGLFSKKVIKPEEVLAAGIEADEGRVLSKTTVQALLDGMLERLEVSVMFGGHRGPLKSFVYSQARMVVRFLLRESSEYVPFVLGW